MGKTWKNRPLLNGGLRKDSLKENDTEKWAGESRIQRIDWLSRKPVMGSPWIHSVERISVLKTHKIYPLKLLAVLAVKG